MLRHRRSAPPPLPRFAPPINRHLPKRNQQSRLDRLVQIHHELEQRPLGRDSEGRSADLLVPDARGDFEGVLGRWPELAHLRLEERDDVGRFGLGGDEVEVVCPVAEGKVESEQSFGVERLEELRKEEGYAMVLQCEQGDAPV